ncbi:unnamed protein product [Effrenium voratum]|uniref:Uncharacterized protein n=1 Tax=Effrenium voratum TaxID=2562239 RepID=A0AA36JK01_9DINO|nr:unnamed protein product [Effrenium voratum]CAJ1407084.1 unnamed protein product [Effrenium voratum]
MVKTTSLTKSELVDVLGSAKTSKERNRAVKLLKQFDPVPHYEFDDEGLKAKMRPKKYDYLLGYMCFRCDKVKQSNFKVIWSTSKGNKIICPAPNIGLEQACCVDSESKCLERLATLTKVP